MLEEHKVDDKIKVVAFVERVKAYGYSNIESTNHTFKRLSQKQREVYTEEELKRIIFNEKPLEVGIQKNRNYVVIYNFRLNKYIRILLDFTTNKIYIVTFYILNKEQQKDLTDGSRKGFE